MPFIKIKKRFAMQKSESLGQLSLALSKVQSKLNTNFTSCDDKELELKQIWDAVRDLLAINELAIFQMPTDTGGVTTVISHSSGEYLQSTCYVPCEENEASVRNAVSAARVMGMVSFLGIPFE
jgi:hypothetical protein